MNKRILTIVFLVIISQLLIIGCTREIVKEKIVYKDVDCPVWEERVCPECDTTTEKLSIRETAICEMESKLPVECKVYRKTQTGIELVGTEVCSDDEYAYTYATTGTCVCRDRVCKR